ncbi:MAG: hypothetical protein AAFX95_23840 [Cyanobacteria bacterium J06639_16]
MSIPTPTQQQCNLLAEALDLARCLVFGNRSHTEASVIERRRDRLRQIQVALESFTHPICRDRLPLEQIPLTVRQAFVRAVLLVTRYHQAGGVGWQGTLASPTLSNYHPDPIPEGWKEPGAIAQWNQQFQLGAEFEVSLTQLLTTVDERLRQQRAIMQAILADADAGDGTGALSKTAIAVLFQALFEIQIPVDKIHCIYTPLQFYFCLDFPPAIDDPSQGWDGVDADNLEKLRALQNSLSNFSFAKFRRFPTFGPCNPVHIDSAWANRIGQKANCSSTQVVQAMAQTVGVLPVADAEAFLLHDIWGHYWQLVLTQFEGDYAILADCHEPLRAGETAYTAAGPLTCFDLFELVAPDLSQVRLDEDKARQFFHAEVRQRLGLLFTHLIGEIVADVAEFKFIWTNPDNAKALPGSSLFKQHPTNFDLSLGDLDFLFLRWLQPLLALNLSVIEPCPLETDVLTHWQTQGAPVDALTLQTGLKGAIAQLYQLFLTEYQALYLPTISNQSGLFTQIASNLLQLQNVINCLYTDPELARPGPFPFQDLLIVFISSYCCLDSYAEFWQVDDVLATYFIPCWRWLHDQHSSAN